MVVSIIAARALEVDAFGIFGILFAFTTAVQSVVQGGYIDVLLRDGVSNARSFWSADRFFPIAVILGLVPVLADNYLELDFPLLAFISASGCAFLFVRYSWVRAFYHTQGRVIASVSASCSLFVIAATFLAISFVFNYRGWVIVAIVSVVAYGLSGLASYVDSFRSSRNSDAGHGPTWRWDYAVESAILVGSMQMSSIFITPALGLQFSAGYRGGAMLYGPLSMVFSALRLVLLPKLSLSSNSLRSLFVPSISIIGLVFAWGGIVFYGVVFFGSEILGDSAQTTQSLMVWFALSYASQGLYLVMFLAGRAWFLDAAIRWGRATQLILLLVGVLGSIFLVTPEPYFLGTIVGNIAAGAMLAYKVWRI